MLISMNWIGDFVDLSGLDLEALIHRFTLSYETADSITVRNTQIYGKGLQPVSFEGNEFAIDLRLTRPVPSNTSGLWFSGDFDYNGEEYSFNISL